MPELHLGACEVDESEDVLDMYSLNNLAEALHPGEVPFHLS